MALWNGFYSLSNFDWVECGHDFKNYRYVIVITHRNVRIRNYLDMGDTRFVDFINLAKIAFKEIDIYLDMIWG